MPSFLGQRRLTVARPVPLRKRAASRGIQLALSGGRLAPNRTPVINDTEAHKEVAVAPYGSARCLEQRRTVRDIAQWQELSGC
jgi:hypothetical protein